MSRKHDELGTAPSVSLTIRIPPKVKYQLELLARLQRRSATAVIEWLVTQAAASELTWGSVGVLPKDEDGPPLQALAEILWAPSETERLANLGKYAPSLMTFEEEFAYRVIFNDSAPWIAGFLESLNEQPQEDAERIKAMSVEEFAEMIKARSKASPDAPLTRNSRERRLKRGEG